MTHFETLLVESLRDLAKQVQENNEICVRLDERSASVERRLAALEAAPPASARRRRIEPREAVVGGTALVALVTAIAQAFTTPAAPPAHPVPPAPRPAVAAGAP